MDWDDLDSTQSMNQLMLILSEPPRENSAEFPLFLLLFATGDNNPTGHRFGKWLPIASVFAEA